MWILDVIDCFSVENIPSNGQYSVVERSSVANERAVFRCQRRLLPCVHLRANLPELGTALILELYNCVSSVYITLGFVMLVCCQGSLDRMNEECQQTNFWISSSLRIVHALDSCHKYRISCSCVTGLEDLTQSGKKDRVNGRKTRRFGIRCGFAIETTPKIRMDLCATSTICGGLSSDP